MVQTIDRGTQAEVLGEVQRLYDLGLFLQAWRAAAPLGPLEGWSGLDARILAGRLWMQLGDQPRAIRCHLGLRRLHASSQRAWYWIAWAVRARLGPYAAQTLLRARVEEAEGTGEGGAELVGFAASTAAMLKDFPEAERLLARAERMDPGSAWIRIERAHVLRAADDYAGALAAAEEASRLRPAYRPALEARADLLVLLGRDDEALALLTDGMERFESASIGWALAQLQEAREDVAGAEATLVRVEAWSPLRNRALVEYLARRRSDLAWRRGDREATIRLAKASRNPFHEKLAARLEAGHEGPRRALPVPFVRQHDKTCAPATLTALSRFHGVEARHLEVAEKICYDGTPDWAQRRWAEEQGFVVREFTVTWDATRALVDRGLPFSLATIDPGSGHLQAVVGYDEGRGTLLLRDSNFRVLGELAAEGLEAYRATGPQGAVMVPRDRAAMLDGLELPDAHLYDLYHRVQIALAAHRRDEADAARRALAEAAPGHRLALHVDRVLACYDADEEARLAATDRLLALFPDDVNLRLSRQASLAELGRHLARVEYLRAERARAPHPLLSLVLAEAIRLDARTRPEVEGLVRTLLRALPHDPAVYRLLGHVQWERDRGEALRAYRAAACLGWAEEHHAESLFRAARSLGKVEEGLELLRWRERRQGGLSGQPAMTLSDALEALDRTSEALEVLEAAVARRPQDGALLLFAARARAAAGQLADAHALLARARTSAHPAQVLRTEAALAERAGDVATAAARWEALAELDPLDVGAARAAARSLAATRGEEAARAWVRSRAERFPHHQGLSHVLLEWLGDEPPAVVEVELRRLLAAHPGDAWAWRELALVRSRQGDVAGALEVLERAAAIDPATPPLHNVRASVLAAAGRIDEAKAELLRSLACDADGEWALDRLLELSADGAERRAHLATVRGELRRQVVLGDGILAYQSRSTGILAEEDVLAELREAHRLRPDLWHSWVALARQLAHVGRLDEAGGILSEAAERFPLLPRIPLEQAALARAAGDRDATRRALERAVALSPGWPQAAIDLAAVLHEAGDFPAELAVLERALRHAPSQPLLHGWRADALRLSGREEEARAALERALRLDPGYAWAWETLVELCRRRGAPGHPLAFAESLAAERPHDSGAWVLVARARKAPEDRLEPLERAVQARPRDVSAWELRVDTLAALKRFDEALASTDPPAFGGVPPPSLRLRAVKLHDARGDRARALDELRALVAREGDDLEAWQLLADWEDAAGNGAASLAAADTLVRLAPHRAASHGYRGQALLRTGARAEGKAALRRALDLDPSYGWAVDRLLAAELEDGWTRAEVLEELRRRLARCPDHEGLGRTLLVWMRDEPPAAAEPELRRFLGVHPDNAWGWRELAGVLSRQGRTDEALDALRTAEELEPGVAPLYNVRAVVLQDAGRIEEAKAELLRAIACDADDGWPLRRLVELSAGAEERRTHLRAALAELRRQVTLGDGLLHLQAEARGVLPPEELVAALRAASAERPELWQTWVALARQLAHAGALDEAREVLAQAAERFPSLPRLAVEQAEVARLRGDAGARREALERAVFLSPGWTEAVSELAALLQDAGEYEAELAMLDRALRNAPAESLLHGWRADALRRSGRTAEALDELEHALHLDPGYQWGWETLRELCADGDPARPGRIAEAIARERPDDVQALLLLARSRSAPADRLAPLERALRLRPRHLGAAELRVDALVELRRFDEALAAAAPPAFGGVPPPPLQLRAVRVHDARGDRARALRELRVLAQREPDFVDALQLLAEWEEEAGDAQAALAAARALVQVTPGRAVSHGYLGHHLLRGGARAEGKAALRTAVELDPSYTWAQHRLLALELEDRDVEAVERLVPILERSQGAGAAHLARVELAARLGKKDEALASLGLLARSGTGWDGRRVAEAFDGAGWGDELAGALLPALADPAAQGGAGELWVQRVVAGARWGEGNGTLDALLDGPHTPAVIAAVGQWVQELGGAGRAGEVARWKARRAAALRSDDWLWGCFGYALVSVARYAEAVAWLGDWRARARVAPWMLVNLAQALRDLGRSAEAGSVSRAALELPADHGTPLHRILLASDAALAGDSGLDPAWLPKDGVYRHLGALVQALDAARAAPPAGAWKAALPHLRAAQMTRAAAAKEPYFRAYRRRAVWAIARRRGGPLAALWYVAGRIAAGDRQR
ncbi:MAG TPA: tetratricopeptide repeat protein [Anaeromyxobacter sp.]|nr:tetratricopeptide repeat protein [Anaeromyxobacter sp.]